MRLILDTHILLWALSEEKKIPDTARDLITSKRNEIFFSAVSVLEVAIKFALRRPDFRTHPHVLTQDALRAEFEELPVTSAAAARVAELPPLHRDPFDRLLVAQAIEADAQLLTADSVLSGYSPHVLAV